MAGHLLGGCASAFWSVMWSTSVQTRVAPDVVNRVNAYQVAGSVAGMAVGQALAGPVTTLVEPRTFMLGSALATAGVVAALLSIRPVRRLGRESREAGGRPIAVSAGLSGPV
jgi:predicted MFS family arabinose efflux permease